MCVTSINLLLQLNLYGTALRPRCLEQCVSLHINYCASVYFLCDLPNPKNHFNQIYRVKTCSSPSSVLYVVQFYCFVKYKSRLCMLKVGRTPCGRNGVDRFVIGKKVSNTFVGFSDSKSQTIIQDISIYSKKKNSDYTKLFFQ